MSCQQNHISQMLTDYFSGHLDENDSFEVERHLPHCQDCRKSLKTMRLMAGQVTSSGPLNVEGHLEPETISTYYQNRDGLETETAAAIDVHLKDCDKCSYEYAFLVEMEAELSRSVASALEAPGPLERVFSFLTVVVRKPALAYFLLVLTIYPAASWLLETGGTGPGTEVSQTQTYQLRDLLRGQVEPTVVERSHPTELIRLSISWYHSRAGFKYEFQVHSSGADGGVADSALPIQSFASFDTDEIIEFIIPTSDLVDGLYILLLTETDLEDPAEISSQSYLFELITQ